MTYKPGDAVWAYSSNPNLPKGWLAGNILQREPRYDYMTVGCAYELTLLDYPETHIGPWICPDSNLRPRFDDGDSSARGDWAQLPWRPGVKRPESEPAKELTT